jgi:hypothetical protein
MSATGTLIRDPGKKHYFKDENGLINSSPKLKGQPDLRKLKLRKTLKKKNYLTSLLLLQARNVLVKIWRKELSPYGISPEQAEVLFIIQSLGNNSSPMEISVWTLREPNSVSELLSRMENQRLIKKTRKSDRKNRIMVS